MVLVLSIPNGGCSVCDPDTMPLSDTKEKVNKRVARFIRDLYTPEST